MTGRFSADRYEVVAGALRAAQATLSPALRELPGLIDYYAGIDRAGGTLVSVSVWDSPEHAAALADDPARLDARSALAEAGVTWDVPVSVPVTWWVQPA